jgi:transposase
MNPHPPLTALCYQSYYDKTFKSNPADARNFLVHLVTDLGCSITSTASACGITRPTVHKALRRFSEKGYEGLGNLSRRPKNCPKQIDLALEEEIVKLRKQTNFGCLRIACELRERLGINIHHNTVARVFKRNGIRKRKRIKSANQELRDYYLSPLRFWEIDTKEITDLHALPRDVYDHVTDHNLPIYQYTAIDTYTRLRILGYSHHNTFENGWSFIQYVIQCNREAKNHQELVIQTDNGMEYGGYLPNKLIELNQELKELEYNTTLIHIPKMQKQKQGHVERSHRTDDEELYIPHLKKAGDTKEFLELAQKWVWYYNNRRSHQGKYMNLMPPARRAYKLQEQGVLANSVNLSMLTNVPVLHFDSISTRVLDFISKLKAQVFIQRDCIKEQGLSVNDVCVEYPFVDELPPFLKVII